MEPHVHQLDLSCSSARAFEVFTGEMGSWWDPRYSPDPDAYSGMLLEPRVGGTVALRVGERTYPWGSVTAWEPGIRYAQTCRLAMDPAHPSTLDVHVALARGAGCQVRFEHGGWTEANLGQREKFGDWPRILDRYAAATAA
jgi:hypothetical protein